jgi:hypothetical protein
MKGLRKWTGQADDGERKFKGWSDSGHKAFEQLTMNIKNDVRRGTYITWEKAFQEVHVEQEKTKKNEEEPVEKYSVNKSVVWEL